jgi:hypothetical protein
MIRHDRRFAVGRNQRLRRQVLLTDRRQRLTSKLRQLCAVILPEWRRRCLVC